MKKIWLKNLKDWALIDDEDVKVWNEYNWYGYKYKRGENSYVIGEEKMKGGKKHLRLHRLILKAKEGEMVDHINGNGLDNRKENLRICDRAGNMRNKRKVLFTKGKPATSRFKGVILPKVGNWRATIKANGKVFNLGSYETEEQAALAYNFKARELFGEFARLNQV